jgi:hypothetical protein
MLHALQCIGPTPVQCLPADVFLRAGVLQLHIAIVCQNLPARCTHTLAVLQESNSRCVCSRLSVWYIWSCAVLAGMLADYIKQYNCRALLQVL